MAVTAHSFHCHVVPPSGPMAVPAFTVQTLLEPFLQESGFVFLNAVPPMLDLAASGDCVVALGQRRGGNVLSQKVVARGAIPGLGKSVDVHLTRMEASTFSIRHPAWNTAYNKGQDTRKRLGICVPDTRWLEGDVRLVSRVSDAMVPTAPGDGTTTFVLEMIAVPKRKQEAPFKVDLVRCSTGKFDNAHYLICDESNGRRSVGPWFLVDLYQRNYSKRLKEAHKVVCLSVYRTERGQTMPSSAVPQHFMATHIVNREKWPQNLQRDLSLPPWCTLRGTEHVARGSAVDTELVLRSPDRTRAHTPASAPIEFFSTPLTEYIAPVAKSEPNATLNSLCQKRTSSAVPLSTKRRAGRRTTYGHDPLASSFDEADLMELIGDSPSDEMEFYMDSSCDASPVYVERDPYPTSDACMQEAEAHVQPSYSPAGSMSSFGIMPSYSSDSVLDAFQRPAASQPIEFTSNVGRASFHSWEYQLTELDSSSSPLSEDQPWPESYDTMEEEPMNFSWADRLVSP